MISAEKKHNHFIIGLRKCYVIDVLDCVESTQMKC